MDLASPRLRFPFSFSPINFNPFLFLHTHPALFSCSFFCLIARSSFGVYTCICKMGDSEVKKRRRDESEEGDSDIDSPEVKRMRDNLLDCLDEDSEIHATGLDLDSFMKSFEKEITNFPSAGGGDLAAVEVVDLTSDSGESRPDLGYLLEASDDDLGLPPKIAVDTSDFGAGLWGFEAEVLSYDPRGFGSIQTEVFDGGNDEYAVIDGLFDYSDMGFESGDFMWRHETLQAQ